MARRDEQVLGDAVYLYVGACFGCDAICRLLKRIEDDMHMKNVLSHPACFPGLCMETGGEAMFPNNMGWLGWRGDETRFSQRQGANEDEVWAD